MNSKKKRRLKRILRMFGRDSIDWGYTMIRLFWMGLFALLVVMFSKELIIFSLAASEYDIDQAYSMAHVLSWTFGLIYIIARFPIMPIEREEGARRKR